MRAGFAFGLEYVSATGGAYKMSLGQIMFNGIPMVYNERPLVYNGLLFFSPEFNPLEFE